MKPLYTKKEFNRAKSTDLLPIECPICGKPFMKLKRVILRHGKIYPDGKQYSIKYCSNTCKSKYMDDKIECTCKNCGTSVLRTLSHFNKIKNVFCSKSCAATYNNTHKEKGTRRSKLESWLELKLSDAYPLLQILYCDKTAINAELDIYVPSLRLAFELNGIYHYEPIHGTDKLSQIKNNDQRKFQACIEHNIELVIMDVSGLKYFKENNCQKYLDIIVKIISNKSV